MTRRPPSSTLFPSTPLSRSLPNVARHVIKPVAVGRETGNRSGSTETVGLSVFIWETALPDVRLPSRSEEHTSELQSRLHLVCRLLLAKKTQPQSITPTEIR